jgi:hypothetical protein
MKMSLKIVHDFLFSLKKYTNQTSQNIFTLDFQFYKSQSKNRTRLMFMPYA